jgi:hypothetical protein
MADRYTKSHSTAATEIKIRPDPAIDKDAVRGNRRVMSIHVVELGRNGRLSSGRGQHPRTAAASELRELLGALRLTRSRFAHLLGRAPRTIRHWACGTRPVPREAAILLRLAHAGKITVTEIAAAAARPLHGLEPVVGSIADPEPAVEVGIGIGIGQLTSRTCRWPLWENGTPAAGQMRFCGEPTIVSSSYCSAHAVAAARRGPGRPRST